MSSQATGIQPNAWMMSATDMGASGTGRFAGDPDATGGSRYVGTHRARLSAGSAARVTLLANGRAGPSHPKSPVCECFRRVVRPARWQMTR
ncbi:hypothetical protein JCM9957A_59710 [Kineosporia succinea]